MDVFKTTLVASLIGASAIAGVSGAPLWVLLLTGLGLSSIAIREQHRLRERFAGVGAGDLLTASHFASVANSSLTIGAAWCVGAILKLAVQYVQ